MEVPEAETLEREDGLLMLACKYYDHDQRVRRSESISPYVSLAAAIIRQAADDYERMGEAGYKKLDNMPVFKSEIRNFIRGKWFAMLTIWCDPIDPEDAIRALDRRAAHAADT